MRTGVKKAARDESGKILIMVLVLLVVGGLVLAPLLGLMSTGLMAGQVYEKKASELYAADAGVEDAIWKIANRKAEFDKYGYCSYPDPDGGVAELWVVNEKSVDVEIYREEIGRKGPCHIEYAYQILSSATGAESSTDVAAYLYIVRLHLSFFLGHAIVSDYEVTLQPETNVYGDIYLPDGKDLKNLGEDNIHGTVIDETDPDGEKITWPTALQLSEYYLDDVAGVVPWPNGTLYVYNDPPTGALLRKGELKVNNSPPQGTKGATLKLGGTWYVDGDLEFQQPGGSNYTIDLAGRTIFVTGRVDLSSNSITITGSGCIIAVGDIVFQPSVKSSPDDFVLVMSVEGDVWFKPKGDLTGCVAGKKKVQIHPDGDVHAGSLDGTRLNFPMDEGDEPERLPLADLSIISWQIQQGGQ